MINVAPRPGDQVCFCSLAGWTFPGFGNAEIAGEQKSCPRWGEGRDREEGAKGGRGGAVRKGMLEGGWAGAAMPGWVSRGDWGCGSLKV